VVHLGLGRHSTQEGIVEVLSVKASRARQHNTDRNITHSINSVAGGVASVICVTHPFELGQLSVVTSRVRSITPVVVSDKANILHVKEEKPTSHSELLTVLEVSTDSDVTRDSCLCLLKSSAADESILGRNSFRYDEFKWDGLNTSGNDIARCD